MQSLSFYLLSLLFLTPIAWGEGVKTNHAIAELVSEFTSAQAGSKPWIGLRLEMEKHWHTYWRNPGDSGLPTKVIWELPSGWKISEPKWEIPQRIPLPPIVNLGYSNETLLGYELEIPSGVKTGEYFLHGKASWLICKEECIPEKADLQLKITVANGEKKTGPAYRMFQKLRTEQPIALPSGAFLALRMQEKDLQIDFDNDPRWLVGEVDFFPYQNELVSLKDAPKVTGAKTITLSLARAEPFSRTAKALNGILIANKKVYELSADLPTDRSAFGATSGDAGLGGVSTTDQTVAAQAAESPLGAWLAILFAFLGGLLLNLMPCVFPVLGIKVMSFVHQNSGANNKSARHGYLYTLGVIVSFWILAGALLIFRSAGEKIGWGFQLQEPLFVIGLIYLFALLTANLAGFFEIGGRWMGLGGHLTETEGNWGAFFTGVLAVLVATPCTAPFMGAAIGAVISEPSWIVLLVFTSLGLGLALPFLIFSLRPDLLKYLPKPGVWMLRLKEFFAFPMAATVIWLLWVFGQQVGVHGLGLAAIGVLVLFGAIWIFHRFQSWVRYLGWLLVIGALALGWKSATSFVAAKSSLQQESSWRQFSPEAVAKDIQSGKAVFVDFTAAWCLTCQANKALVLDTKEIQNFFQAQEVVLYLADWTNNDPVITKELERYGRIGVPLYLAYPSGSTTPQVLPQILTKEIIKEAFAR